MAGAGDGGEHLGYREYLGLISIDKEETTLPYTLGIAFAIMFLNPQPLKHSILIGRYPVITPVVQSMA